MSGEFINGEAIDRVKGVVGELIANGQATSDFPGFPAIISVLGISFSANMEKQNTLDDWNSSCRIVMYPRQMPEKDAYLTEVLEKVFPKEGETIECRGQVFATMLQVSPKKVVIIGEPCGTQTAEEQKLQAAVFDICLKNPGISPTVCFIEF